MEHVLIIGSGKRVQENFIPALRCLPNDFSIIGIHSRTPEHYRRVGAAFGITPIEKVNDDVLKRTDVVAISAPPKVWVEWLPVLLPHAARLTLVIDTPLRLFSLDLLPKLAQFKRVLVTEDYLGFPQFELLRTFCASGAIGRIREIRLLGNGYRYHGTSLIRSFVNFAAPVWVRSEKHSDGLVDLHLRFADGTRAVMREPYAPESGRIEIVGEHGSVTSQAGGGFTHHLASVVENGQIAAFEIQAKDKLFRQELTHRVPLRALPKHDDFEIEKTHGLIAVFESIVRPNIYTKYGYEEALYEEWLSETPRVSSWWFLDPFAALGLKTLRSRGYWIFAKLVSLCFKIRRRFPAISRP